MSALLVENFSILFSLSYLCVVPGFSPAILLVYSEALDAFSNLFKPCASYVDGDFRPYPQPLSHRSLNHIQAPESFSTLTTAIRISNRGPTASTVLSLQAPRLRSNRIFSGQKIRAPVNSVRSSATAPRQLVQSRKCANVSSSAFALLSKKRCGKEITETGP